MRKIKTLCTTMLFSILSLITPSACANTYKSNCNASFSFPIAGEGSLAFDQFRSLPDGSWEGNTGAVASLNLGMPLPLLSCYDMGFQVGGSYGIYDWSGRGSAPNGNPKKSQQQLFLSTALFKKTPSASGINLALAYDWMMNKNFGVFALNPNLTQFRFSVAYQLNRCDEMGLWGTVGTGTSHKVTQQVPVEFRAISQLNLFWRHHWKNCAQTTIWVGTPYRKGLMQSSGRAGDYILGASFRASLTHRLSIDGHASYMHARHSPGIFESRNYASNVYLGLTYAFGHMSKQHHQCFDFTPYLPVANNSNFIVDTNVNY